MACPFCGSEEIYLDTPYVETSGHKIDEFQPIKTICCPAQKKNADYILKNFHPDDAPSLEEISKL